MSSLPFYRSPEALRGKYDIKSDIWSLGCIVYELMFLKPAFSGNSYQEVMNKIFTTQY